MGLQAMLHLQNVFKSAEKVISIEQLSQFSGRDQTAVAKPRQADQCMRSPEPAVLAAVRQLEGLGDELDLAYASTAKFYVVPIAARQFAVDLFLRTANIRE